MMKTDTLSLLARIAAFLTVCGTAMAAMVMVFGQIRFADNHTYRAQFASVTGLRSGDFVRIAGVEVGKVKGLQLQTDSTVSVEFTADADVSLTDGNRLVIRYDNLIGDRFLAIEEGTLGEHIVPAGATIPISHTQPALDLDDLVGGFRPLFRALNPDQVNTLTAQLVRAFDGQGDVIVATLEQITALTNSLADRDQLIGDLITNLDTVMATVADRGAQFDSAVDSLSQLIAGLSGRKDGIATAIAHASTVAGTVADLLTDARPPLSNVVQQADRTASLVLADHEYVDNLLATLPDTYRMLGRQGLYGDFFSFYMCDIYLKINGKGGQPVYTKLAGQSTGRCTPK